MAFLLEYSRLARIEPVEDLFYSRRCGHSYRVIERPIKCRYRAIDACCCEGSCLDVSDYFCLIVKYSDPGQLLCCRSSIRLLDSREFALFGCINSVTHNLGLRFALAEGFRFVKAGLRFNLKYLLKPYDFPYVGIQVDETPSRWSCTYHIRFVLKYKLERVGKAPLYSEVSCKFVHSVKKSNQGVEHFVRYGGPFMQDKVTDIIQLLGE